MTMRTTDQANALIIINLSGDTSQSPENGCDVPPELKFAEAIMNDFINPADVRFQVLRDIQKGLKSRVKHAASDAKGAITFSLFLAGVLFAGFLAIGFLTINLNNRLNNIESVISQPPPEPVITLAKEKNFT